MIENSLHFCLRRWEAKRSFSLYSVFSLFLSTGLLLWGGASVYRHLSREWTLGLQTQPLQLWILNGRDTQWCHFSETGISITTFFRLQDALDHLGFRGKYGGKQKQKQKQKPHSTAAHPLASQASYIQTIKCTLISSQIWRRGRGCVL